jgi:hypothetical protein
MKYNKVVNTTTNNDKITEVKTHETWVFTHQEVIDALQAKYSLPPWNKYDGLNQEIEYSRYNSYPKRQGDFTLSKLSHNISS